MSWMPQNLMKKHGSSPMIWATTTNHCQSSESMTHLSWRRSVTKGWRTFWQWSLYVFSRWFFSPQTWRRGRGRRVPSAAALQPTASALLGCWHMLPLPLAATWTQGKVNTDVVALTLRGWVRNEFSLLCQGPVILDLLLPHTLVLLPPALGAQALPRRISIVTASLFAQQVRLVHMNAPSLCPLTHDAGRPGMKDAAFDLLQRHGSLWFCWRFLPVRKQSFLPTVAHVLLRTGDCDDVTLYNMYGCFCPFSWHDLLEISTMQINRIKFIF